MRRLALQWFCLLYGLACYGLAIARPATDYDRLLTVWAGSLPIILAAPHGGRQTIPGIPPRRGFGIAQFTVERDGNTAELAELVGSKLALRMGVKPFVVIASFARKYLDANRPAAMAYENVAAKPYYDAYHGALRQAVDEVRQKWRGGLLLDIHGQGADGQAIFRGTDNGKSVTGLTRRFGRAALTGPTSILGQLAAKGYKVLPGVAGADRESRYSGGYTIRTYGSHRGTDIDGVQLEFGTDLRAKPNLERTAGDLAEAIEVFARNFLPLSQNGNGYTSGPRP